MLPENVTECVTLLFTDAGIIIGPGCGLGFRLGETAGESLVGLAFTLTVKTETLFGLGLSV